MANSAWSREAHPTPPSRQDGHDCIAARAPAHGGGARAGGVWGGSARGGQEVLIGSRAQERAEEATRKVKEALPEAAVEGRLNAEAVDPAEVVFLPVPWDAHQSSLEHLAEAIGEKVLVDVVVPMLFDRGQPKAILVDEGAAAHTARALGPTATG